MSQVQKVMAAAIVAVILQQVISVWMGEHDRQHVRDCERIGGELIQHHSTGLMCVGGRV